MIQAVWAQQHAGCKSASDLGLQLVMLRLVLLQHIQQEGSGLAHSIALQEEVCQHVEVHGRAWLLGNHLGQVDSSLWVVHHEALHEVQVVRLVACLSAVRHELIEVALASQACTGQPLLQVMTVALFNAYKPQPKCLS